MKKEYDFSKAERGKYSREYGEGTNVIFLDADVAKVFPDSDSVNKTLRWLIQNKEILKLRDS